ncbi:hypothetical protein [Paenibacillus amylolyticus]|uniref:Uncharacterized protein n=1 Tax=Paenibacillus amylolyticus TaxID=1451 RepID=A0A100VMF0_PAEAM|nr:hypothetical protein [Paenibacillus amylolyticus]GAS82409.1 unknown protein [Paenibacillus amylolyticus]
MKKNRIIAFSLLILSIPVFINYGLFSWEAPGLNGDSGDWLGFLANFLGLIGAVLIALFQMKEQKDGELVRDIESNRSYIDVQDFTAPLMLKGVVTHENSRIIQTDGYDALVKRFRSNEYKEISVGYLKMAHYGTAELIFDCSFSLSFSYLKNGIKVSDTESVSIGVFEKGIEIFIPLVPEGIDKGVEIELFTVTIDYSTIKGERLQLHRDYVSKKETLYSIVNNAKNTIFEYDMKMINWIYPNKIDHTKLAP